MWQLGKRWELRMEYLHRWAKSSRCQLQGGGEEQKSQKEEKESEERSVRWYPGSEGTVYDPGIADWLNVTSCGDLWWDSKSKSDYQLFPRNGGFGVTAVHRVQRREFASHPRYTKLYIFGKPKDRALEWTQNKFTWTNEWGDLPWIQHVFKRSRSKNFEQSWVSERTFCLKPIEVYSKATQLRLHMQGVIPE